MEKVFSPKLFGLIKDGSVKKNLSKDILAGVVVGIVAIPLAIAFSVACGVSPEKGIITAIVAGFLISLLGGSRVQIGGPTGAFIVIIYGIIQQYGIDGMIIATILAGVIMIGFGLLRLGTLLKFIPHPLIVGFTSGIALVIFSTQISNALGLTLAEVPSSFIGKWGAYFSNINTVNWYAVGITVVTILITVYMPKITSRVPGSFVARLVITPLATTSNRVVEIIMFFMVDTIWPDNSMNRVNQRIHLSWIMNNEVPQIRLCHISNAISYDERDTIYPVHYDSKFRGMPLAGVSRSERW